MKQTTQNKTHNKKSLRSHSWLRWAAVIAVMMAWMMPAKAQTDYSGVYYIRSYGQYANASNIYYLCPTEGWCYYKPFNSFSGDGTTYPNPFLTTYKCKTNDYHSGDSRTAIWTIEKVPNSNYYHIKQTSTGRYLLSNGKIGNATIDRIRVHLEAVADPSTLGDSALFEISPYSNNNAYLTFKTVGINETGTHDKVDHSLHRYLTVNGGNKNFLTGQSGKTGGPTGYENTAGIVGIYTESDVNAPFDLEEAVLQPVISQAANGNVNITSTSNTTIYYTLNGDAPVVPADGAADPTGPTYKYISTIDTAAIGSTGVKAVAVLSSMHAAYSKTANYPFVEYTTPTITFDGLDQVTISAAHADATIYYTTDGNDPVVGTLYTHTYSGPLTINTTTTVKAVATHTGFLTSAVADSGPLEPGSIDAPIVNYNCDNSVSLEVTVGAIYYNIGNGSQADPDNTSTPYENPFTPGVGEVIKAITYISGNYSTVTSETYHLTHTAVPTIESDEGTVTITGPTTSSTIYFTIDGTDPTTSLTSYSSPHEFTVTSSVTVKAIAQVGELLPSCVVSRKVSAAHSIRNADDLANIADDLAGDYIILNNINASSFSTISGTFTGTLEAAIDPATNMPYRISSLQEPLFNTINNSTVKNVMLDNVKISNGTNVGAICDTATGDSRIYNCGVLATNSTATTDEDGYTKITSCSSTISGSGYVGGLVGLLNGSSRVINCFSYADVSGGSYVGGIVGYNNVATTANNLKTMVMNCMFYGEVSGSSRAPIYNGQIITNDGDASGVNNFNYFRLEAAYIQNTSITKVYNCALGAETRFLQRFEFFRHLLNSNRELAAWWATDDVANKDEMMKWVMIPDSIGTATPYPILKTPDKYASVVNYAPSETVYDGTKANRNKGHKLTSLGDGGVLHVTIQMGSGGTRFLAPSGAGLKSGETGRIDLTITDKDFEHFNFNYGKVQLPYYNDYCDGNYTGNRVVTGWKIVSITGTGSGTTSYSSGAEDVTYSDGELTATPYNFADRKCTGKDLYGTSGRIFNQGAYWDVPEKVTAITIEPYWGRAVYLSDAYWDVTYKNSSKDAMATANDVTTVGGGQRYSNGESTFNSQTVYTALGNAISSSVLYSESVTNPTVYDYAVVLVGNYHHNGDMEASLSKPYTITSVDLDGDNEPDYSYILRFDSRKKIHPVRVDFINIPGLGMAQKSTGGTGTYNFGIMQPLGWFESTNTSLFRVTQFEYDCNKDGKTRVAAPYILQGGVMEQWVLGQNQGYANNTTYFHVGGNVWFKEFHRGTHQDENYPAKHPPVSVTGGDFDQFHLTGLYKASADTFDDNAECYITGGRFRVVAGTGMDGIGTTDGKGDITWIIDNADIKEFYAGSFNAAKPAIGKLHTIIHGGYIEFFCGGPKFGDMSSGKTVKTIATDCTFGTFFGAGYGGSSYSRQAPYNANNKINIDWNEWIKGNTMYGNASQGDNPTFTGYKRDYKSAFGGVSTQFSYQFIPMSGNLDNCARLWIEFVKFSLATTHNVTSTLKQCTIENNFYGGGSLGKVDGTVTSVLDSCTVFGNVFGAGFSASLPTVEVDSIGGFRVQPYYYSDLGTYRTDVKGGTITYKWAQTDPDHRIEDAPDDAARTALAIDQPNKILYTDEDLSKSNLGSVNTATLTLKGNTTVGTLEGGILKAGTGNVYGGGDESAVTSNTTVNIQEGATILGNVYGGGNEGPVGGNSEVIIKDSETP